MRTRAQKPQSRDRTHRSSIILIACVHDKWEKQCTHSDFLRATWWAFCLCLSAEEVCLGTTRSAPVSQILIRLFDVLAHKLYVQLSRKSIVRIFSPPMDAQRPVALQGGKKM